MSSRAKSGGEKGKNGEWYKGGQFLPSSENTIKGAQKTQKRLPTGKQEVAPYVWEKPPVAGVRSIWDRIGYLVSYIQNPKDCQYVKGQGLVGLQVKRSKFDEWNEPYTPEVEEFLQVLIERWNNGERWYKVETSPLLIDRMYRGECGNDGIPFSEKE